MIALEQTLQSHRPRLTESIARLMMLNLLCNGDSLNSWLTVTIRHRYRA